MRRLLSLVAALALAWLLVLPVCAEGQGEVLGETYTSFVEGIPDDVAELLPDDLFSSDMDKVAGAAQEVSGFAWLLDRILTILGAELDGAVSLFGRLLSVLVMAALASLLKGAVGSDAIGSAVELCTSAAVIGSVISLTGEAVTAVGGFFERISTLVNGMIPLTGALLALGGNINTAVVSGGGMMIFLNIIENLCAATLAPVVGVCVAIAVSEAFFGGGRLRGIGNFVKKLYTYFLGTVMLLLTFTLSVQTNLSASADSVAMKSAKMLAGRAIPVVGGAVGDTLRTVAGSVVYLKSTVGAVGVAAVALVLLPPLCTVLIYRMALVAASACADLLGCSTEGKLLESFVTVYGYLLAVMCICAVTTIFLLTMFVKCSVAMA